jgi:hypothetical protein
MDQPELPEQEEPEKQKAPQKTPQPWISSTSFDSIQYFA